ncbi:MAG: hypothetical protein R6X02_23620, partial [Enhygromyxa sp.]
MSILEWRRRLTGAWVEARMRRRVWVGSRRAYVELEPAPAEGFSSALQAKLEAVPGIAWARVNAALGRVVVRFSGEPPPSERLVEVVDALEREFDAGVEPASRPRPAEPRRGFPGDQEPVLRSAVELGTDAGALWLALVMRALRFEVGSKSLSLAALISVLEFVPNLHERIEQRVGATRAELGLHFTSGVSQVLVQGVSGSVVDALARALRIREQVARGEAWAGAETSLADEPDCHDCASASPDSLDERPRPLPDGPIERYTSRALAAMVGAFGFSFVASRDLAGATASVFGVLPRPARAGREAFVRELGRALARRGTVVMKPEALRVLDRIDVVVVAAGSLRPRALRIEGIVALDGFNERDARRNTMRMLDLADPSAVHEHGHWRIGPIDALRRARPVPVSAALEQQIVAARRPDVVLLGLEHRGQLVALTSLVPMPDPAVEGFVTAAREAELKLVCAGELDEGQRWLVPDRTVAGGEQLLESIRSLQREGHGVCLISEEPSPALAAADLGVGLCSQRPPWGATMICPGRFADAQALVEAVGAAKAASQQSVYLATIGATSGLILSIAGLRRRTVRRVMMAAHTTSLLAMTNGLRLARSVRFELARPSGELTPWHALEADQVLERLGSSREGLSHEAAASRRRPATDKISPWTRFAELMVDELASPFAPVLIAGAGLSAMTGSMIDALLIASVVGFNTALGAVQRYRTDRAIAALDASEGQRARVLRGGQVIEVELDELVLGDLLVLAVGDAVLADARIIEAARLELDESSLTGESLPISKRAEPSFAPA